jgi:hypothetical protein
MSFVDLSLLPESLRIQSRQDYCIELPVEAALEAIDVLEQRNCLLIGWEGRVQAQGKRSFMGKDLPGRASFYGLSIAEAASFCRQSIVSDLEEWHRKYPEKLQKYHLPASIPGAARGQKRSQGPRRNISEEKSNAFYPIPEESVEVFICLEAVDLKTQHMSIDESSISERSLRIDYVDWLFKEGNILREIEKELGLPFMIKIFEHMIKSVAIKDCGYWESYLVSMSVRDTLDMILTILPDDLEPDVRKQVSRLDDRLYALLEPRPLRQGKWWLNLPWGVTY